MKDRFEELARYNAWAGARLREKADAIPDAAFDEDRGAFFGSLSGTLNHIVVGTRMWLDRCQGSDQSWFQSLNQVLEIDRGALGLAMAAEEARLIAQLEASDEAVFTSAIEYQNTRGDTFQTPLHWIVTHVVNHATHHRGQASDIISGLGHPTPEMDLMYYLRLRGVD